MTPARLRPELQVVAAAVASACGVPEPRPPSAAPDWSQLLRLVDRHRVAPLVQRSGWLERTGAPPEVRAGLADRARRDALRSLRLLAVQREALAALAAAGVPAVVLKGAAVAVDAHDDPSARAAGDLDVLVSPESVPRAVHALGAAGFEWYGWPEPDDPDRPQVGPSEVERLPSFPMLSEVALERVGLRLELHWRLFRNARLMPFDRDWLGAPRHVEVQGASVPTLPLASEWLYLLVHGSNHLWHRLKWLADVPALAQRHPELVEPRALDAAGAGHRRSLATGLTVAEAVFGRFLAPESRAWARSVRGARVLVARSLNALAADREPPERISPGMVAGHAVGRMALRRDAGYRVTEMRLLLLEAARAQAVANPRLRDLAAGPLSWTRRSARRLVRRR